MPERDLIGFGLYIGYFIIVGLPLVLLKACFKLPFEVTRKLYHLVIVISIFPLLLLFSTWYAAVLAALVFGVLVYPILRQVEHAPAYRRIAVERSTGEFKSSLLIVQLSLATVIFVFWGVLGEGWRYIAVAAVMAWGFGDAAAALIGKAYGRRPIRHQRIAGKKTVEGTLAMYAVAGLAIFFTLLLYASHPWHVSLPVALLVAPVCAAVELFSNRGLDTLTVPISAGLATLSALTLFSLLGMGV